MKVVLYGEVPPSDGSITLPCGSYEVEDLRWIQFSVLVDGSYQGMATFAVVTGEHAGSKRRIGCVTHEDSEHLAIVDAFLSGNNLYFERRARIASRTALAKAKKIFLTSVPDGAGYTVAFVDSLLTGGNG